MTAKKAKAPTGATVEAFWNEPTNRARFNMKDTTSRTNGQDATLPTVQQARNLAIAVILDTMQMMANIRRTDKDWDGKNDSDVDFSLDLARKELQSLQASKSISEDEFFKSWWQISSVVSLADNALKRECLFKDCLKKLPEDFRVLGDMIELAEAN